MNNTIEDKEELDNDELLEIMKKAPLVSIDLIIKSESGRILLGLRKNEPAKGTWFVPGGIVKKGETFEKAFQRISLKEVKQKFSWKGAKYLGVPTRHYYPNVEKFGERVNIHYMVFPYVVYVAKEFQLEEDDQHWKYGWFDKVELLNESLIHPYTRDYFKEPLKIPNDSGMYRALMAHYIHYDHQFWSRTQILLAVQGAVLVGGYGLRDSMLGPTIMFLGFLITLVVWGLIFRDIKNSRINQKIMDKIATKIFEYNGPKWSPVSLRSDPRIKFCTGRNLIHFVVFLIMVINVGLGTLYITKPNLFPPNDAKPIHEIQNNIKELSEKLKKLKNEYVELDKIIQKNFNHEAEIENTINGESPNIKLNSDG